LYVDLDEVRGHVGIVHRMAQKIRLADQPTCQVLTYAALEAIRSGSA
jgi:hypothetical protein